MRLLSPEEAGCTGHSVYQMLTLTKAWHIPVSVLYCCLSISMRSAVCPALVVGRMSGRIAVGNSEYRSAHHALLQVRFNSTLIRFNSTLIRH